MMKDERITKATAGASFLKETAGVWELHPAAIELLLGQPEAGN
jgi:hypothetical protein